MSKGFFVGLRFVPVASYNLASLNEQLSGFARGQLMTVRINNFHIHQRQDLSHRLHVGNGIFVQEVRVIGMGLGEAVPIMDKHTRQLPPHLSDHILCCRRPPVDYFPEAGKIILSKILMVQHQPVNRYDRGHTGNSLILNKPKRFLRMKFSHENHRYASINGSK